MGSAALQSRSGFEAGSAGQFVSANVMASRSSLEARAPVVAASPRWEIRGLVFGIRSDSQGNSSERAAITAENAGIEPSWAGLGLFSVEWDRHSADFPRQRAHCDRQRPDHRRMRALSRRQSAGCQRQHQICYWICARNQRQPDECRRQPVHRRRQWKQFGSNSRQLLPPQRGGSTGGSPVLSEDGAQPRHSPAGK